MEAREGCHHIVLPALLLLWATIDRTRNDPRVPAPHDTISINNNHT